MDEEEVIGPAGCHAAHQGDSNTTRLVSDKLLPEPANHQPHHWPRKPLMPLDAFESEGNE
jgi:hypothetical protein